MSFGSIAFGILGSLVGIVGLLVVRRHGPRTWWMLNHPVTPVAKLAEGEAGVEGKVTPGEDLLESPISKKPCVLYLLERFNKDDKTQSDYILTEFRATTWGVDDGSGVAEVALTHDNTDARKQYLESVTGLLQMSFEGRSVVNGQEDSYREHVMEEGATVYAQGPVRASDGEWSFTPGSGSLFLAPSRASFEQRCMARTMLGLVLTLLGFTVAAGAVFFVR
jgi:hypothetical protein